MIPKNLNLAGEFFQRQDSYQGRKQSGRITLFTVVLLALLLVIAGVTYTLYAPYEDLPVQQNREMSTTPTSAIEAIEDLEKAPTKKQITQKTIAPEQTTSLSYCAAPDLEVVGFDWDQMSAAIKTRSVNWRSLSTVDLVTNPQYRHYEAENMKSQYGTSFIQEKGNSEVQELLYNSEPAMAFSTGERDADLIIEQYKDDLSLVLTSLHFNPYGLSQAQFSALLDRHPAFDRTFAYDVLYELRNSQAELLDLFMKRVDMQSPLPASADKSGTHLLFRILLNGNFDSLQHALSLGLSVTPKQSQSLYYALKVGTSFRLEPTDEGRQEFRALVRQISDIVGLPSANDVIAISQVLERDPKEMFIQYGIDINEYLLSSVNENLSGFSEEEIDKRLSEAQTQWPHYILRLNPNSSCQNETEFHWTGEELIRWYEQRIESKDDLKAADEELVKISRLYVQRAHLLYYSSRLKVKYEEFGEEKDKEFFMKAAEAFGGEDSDSISKLFSEALTEEQKGLVKMMVVIFSKDPNAFMKSSNMGLVFDELDMLNAVRFGNKSAVAWFINEGIGFGGVDELENGIVYWLSMMKSFEALDDIKQTNIPVYFNPQGLNPHELHYIQCGNYAASPALIRELEVGRDIKQQINSELCEKISGYQRFLRQQDSEAGFK
ncbi:hypothetical protein [Brumicola blandensis]|uniref:Uncharacterized protein n=1 Tax=Brumicola blandensis TaxID=3075611 RepID=A0AAW8R5Q4_9ALTE|nr:hypothetical protein [Alteromonas sp. W409]MDT0583476.1 hypothetical protein [Alteromonas sp. W409]